MEPQLEIIDTGGDTLTVKLTYPDGRNVVKEVRPEAMDGRMGRDLITAMRRSAEVLPCKQ